MHRIPFFRIERLRVSRLPGRRAAVLGSATVLVSLFGACSADKNYEQRQKAWEEQKAAAADAGAQLPAPAVTRSQQGEWVTGVGDIHTTPTCIRNCIPDPPPPPVNCEVAERNYEFLAPPKYPKVTPLWVQPNEAYTYDDYSAAIPVREAVSMQRCEGQESDVNVLHVFGGPYQSWGGGIGRSIKDWWQKNQHQTCTAGGEPAPCESLDPTLGFSGRTIDLSQWDGVSLWARRGPESQAGFRVTVGDKTTDDDLNIDQTVGSEDDHIDTEQKYCKRSRRCECPGPAPCSFSEKFQGYFCFDPKYQDEPSVQNDYPRCGQTACDEAYVAGGPDPEFQGKACTPFQLQSGYTRSFCFEPGVDPDPAEASELCGDHFQTPVRLSTEWQFFTVPFSGMRQQAFGKESPGLSTDQISLVRLTFEGGWIDYYIANVRFYRVKR